MNNIRIVELPACTMASSGYAIGEEPFQEGGTHRRFEAWWTAYDKLRSDRWFSRDFLMYGREEKALAWLYALPKGFDCDCPFPIIDFAGGYYATGTTINDNSGDEERVYNAIKEWIEQSGIFALDEYPGHYDMTHVITPTPIAEALGYRQMEMYVPIKLLG